MRSQLRQNVQLNTARSSAVYLQLVQLLSDLDEAQVELPSEVISQSTVVVMQAQVGGAHLAHPQLLLLETGRGHGVSVFFLRNKAPKFFEHFELQKEQQPFRPCVFLRWPLAHLSILLPRADLLHFLQHLLGFINVALSAQLFSLGQKLSNFLVQLVNFFCLRARTNKIEMMTDKTNLPIKNLGNDQLKARCNNVFMCSPLLRPQRWSLPGSQPDVSWLALSSGHSQRWRTPGDPPPKAAGGFVTKHTIIQNICVLLKKIKFITKKSRERFIKLYLCVQVCKNCVPHQ